MAIRPTQSVAVGTSAVALTGAAVASDQQSGSSVLVKNTGAATVYLGDSTVTSATGFPWTTTDGPLSFDLETGEILYGICATATSSTVAVFEVAV